MSQYQKQGLGGSKLLKSKAIDLGASLGFFAGMVSVNLVIMSQREIYFLVNWVYIRHICRICESFKGQVC